MNIHLIFAITAWVLIFIEYVHARDEQKDAFYTKSSIGFTGIEFSKQAEKCSSKTESAFLAYKVMMRLLFFVVGIFILPWEWAKIVGYVFIGIYLIYQLHHIYEWYILKKENHGRRTVWLFVPVIIVWWVCLIWLLISYK